MCYIIVEAWLFSFPMTPISLLYSVCRKNTSVMNAVGGPHWKVPKIKHCMHRTMQYMYRSAYFSPISSQFSQFVFSLKVIIVTVVTAVICHAYHLWIKPVPLGNYRQMFNRVKLRKYLMLTKVPYHGGEESSVKQM